MATEIFDKLLKLPPLVWIIGLGTLISRFGTTMVLPFLLIYLNQVKHIPLDICGWIIGITYLGQVLMGFWGGMLIDRFGRDAIIRYSLVAYALTFLLFAVVGHLVDNIVLLVVFFTVLNFIAGILRCWIETSGQALISDITTTETVYQAFSLRYTMLNLGVSLGPVVAGLLAVAGSEKTFYVAAVAIFAYYLLWIKSAHVKTFKAKQEVSQYSFSECVKLIKQDRSLQLYVLSSFIIFLAFSQLEANFAYIIWQNTHDMFWSGMTYAMNGIVIVTLQMYLVNKAREYNLAKVFALGALCVTVGVLLFAFAQKQVLIYLVAMIIFTLGEIFSLSISGIVTDQLAPKEFRGVYFGITNLMYLGRVLGTPLALILLSHVGSRWAFTIIGLITLFAIPLFNKAWQIHLQNQKILPVSMNPGLNLR